MSWVKVSEWPSRIVSSVFVNTFQDTVTQFAWRLMSISVSEALVKLLWSIQRWWAWWVTVIELTAALENAMLRTITLWTLLMVSPWAVIAAVDPRPMIVLFDATSASVESEIVPETWMISGPLWATALR